MCGVRCEILSDCVECVVCGVRCEILSDCVECWSVWCEV